MTATYLNKVVQKRKRNERTLWQNSLKALLGDDRLIAPSPVSRLQHRQQKHFIHLFDNIYMVLTVGAQLFWQIQQRNKTKRKCIIIWKVGHKSIRCTHGRRRKCRHRSFNSPCTLRRKCF